MSGKAPPSGSPEMLALETYSFWMSKGAPVGATLAGAGYPKMKAPQPPDYRRGELVIQDNCALCHAKDGLGPTVAGRNVFPPLRGPDSCNCGAGRHQRDNAAAFIQANIPLGRCGSQGNQQAGDVAMYIDAHERPQGPQQFHDDPASLYGTVVEGHLLGANPSAPGRKK